MTLKDFYDRIGGDYDDAIRRLMSDRIAQKFLLRFLFLSLFLFFLLLLLYCYFCFFLNYLLVVANIYDFF